MKYHTIITYTDPDRSQEEVLIDADDFDYRDAIEKIQELIGEGDESLRIRALGVVDYPDNFPVEVVIRRIKE